VMMLNILVNKNTKETMSKIKHPPHQTFKDFAIVEILGKTYICPGWHEVPNGTTRDDVQLDVLATIEKPVAEPEVPEVIGVSQVFEVLSSKGDKRYTVTLDQGRWDCDCPARQFRRGDCKHIKKVKAR
jgi:hypothetical protein